MKAALASYDRVLRQAARSPGASTPIDLVSHTGDPLARLDASQWCTDPRPGDDALLSACGGQTLDVGCGPGRLVAALLRRGVPALGIDISAEAVRQARARGVPAIQGDVFGDAPAVGQWDHILLADGNIGIGGDPVLLLRRCRGLLALNVSAATFTVNSHAGAAVTSVVAELGPPGSDTWRHQVRLSHDGQLSAAFWWAAVAADDLDAVAVAAGMRVLRKWTEEGRWFASLASCDA